jgi:hypothetical protein
MEGLQEIEQGVQIPFIPRLHLKAFAKVEGRGSQGIHTKRQVGSCSCVDGGGGEYGGGGDGGNDDGDDGGEGDGGGDDDP